MAIVEMKRVELLGLKRDKMRYLKKMQQMGCVEVTQRPPDETTMQDAQSEKREEDIDKLIARLDVAIGKLRPYDPVKQGMLTPRPEVTQDQVAAALAARGEITAVVERLEEIERRRGEMRSQDARDRTLSEQLLPWITMQEPLEKLGKTRKAAVYAVESPRAAWEKLEARLFEVPSLTVQTLTGNEGKGTVRALAAWHLEDDAKAEELFRELGISRVSFEGYKGTAVDALGVIGQRMQDADQEREALLQEQIKMADRLSTMRILRDALAVERDQLAAARKATDTRSTFLLRGWVPANRAEALAEAARKISPVCEIQFSDPEEGEKPPTMLHNSKAVSPFESIVRMYSTPDPGGIDPSFIMLPFWVCFFGMMVSDAGYGILMGLGGAFVWWKLKGKGLGQMAFIIALGGLSTILWGAFYGGWFGVSVPARVLSPMDDAIKVLLLCVGVGAIHLLTGLGVAAYMNIKRGKPLDALFDQGFWVMLLAGLGLMLVNGTVGKVLAIAGAVGILLTAGRAKEGNFLKKIVGGLGALYGVTSYLSDLLSYARLFGMGLATGVIGMVVNMLATLVSGSFFGNILAVVILVAMHTFNLFINALGAYVHSCRLQYIEFFNKFYEDGGKDFMPLTNSTRYVDIAD
ncbi:MAG: V-type ATP synthase subunit I [Clostridia bacterium]|nr:V-type ATP synthase subunit I [Clostridia bacterium]